MGQLKEQINQGLQSGKEAAQDLRPGQADAGSGKEKRQAMNPMNVLEGWKTYIAAAGLLGLALWQFSQALSATPVDMAMMQKACESLMAALAAAGLRNAIQKKE